MTRHDSLGPLPEHDEPNFVDLTRLQQVGVVLAVFVVALVVIIVLGFLGLIATGIWQSLTAAWSSS